MNKLIGVLCIVSLCASASLSAVRAKKAADPVSDLIGFLAAKVVPIATDVKKLKDPCILTDIVAGEPGDKGLVAHTFAVLGKYVTLTDKQKAAIDKALAVFNDEVASVLSKTFNCEEAAAAPVAVE